MKKETKMEQTGLINDEFLQDPRVIQAKKLLLEATDFYKKKLVGIHPPLPQLQQNYAKLLKEYGMVRGGNLYFPYLGSGIGNGPLVELLDGSVKYDFICGIGPHFFGHSHLDLIDSSLDAALSNTIMQGNLQQNLDSYELSKMLVEQSGLAHCFLSSSGAMANENALKIAFQKKFPAQRIIAFDHCFVGRSLAVSQITDKPSFREGLPMNYFIDYVPFFDPARPAESTRETLDVLKKIFTRYPGQHAVMIFELVQGEGGFYAGTKEFFISIMELLKQHQILIFDDEVQSFGRTPKMFAFQYFDLEKYIDLVSIGKLSQVCATLFRDEIKPRPGLLSQTFTASTSAIKAACRIIENLIKSGLYGENGKVKQIHEYFVNKLMEIMQRHPSLIRGPFGIGSMIAFTPLDGTAQKVTKFVHQLYEAGVMGFIAGSSPTRVRFLIPTPVITTHDIDEAIKIIEKCLINFHE